MAIGSPSRTATAVRFAPDLHEALAETATALGTSLNWLVNKLCAEGLERLDLDNFRLTREDA